MNIELMNISDDSDEGYILKIDLFYPKDLHNLNSDFSSAPENRTFLFAEPLRY